MIINIDTAYGKSIPSTIISKAKMTLTRCTNAIAKKVKAARESNVFLVIAYNQTTFSKDSKTGGPR